jgi:hypothetical protein
MEYDNWGPLVTDLGPIWDRVSRDGGQWNLIIPPNVAQYVQFFLPPQLKYHENEP